MRGANGNRKLRGGLGRRERIHEKWKVGRSGRVRVERNGKNWKRKKKGERGT